MRFGIGGLAKLAVTSFEPLCGCSRRPFKACASHETGRNRCEAQDLVRPVEALAKPIVTGAMHNSRHGQRFRSTHPTNLAWMEFCRLKGRRARPHLRPDMDRFSPPCRPAAPPLLRSSRWTPPDE